MATVVNTSSMSSAQRYALLRTPTSFGHPVPGPPAGAGGGGAESGPGTFEVLAPPTDDHGPVSEPPSSNTTPPPPAAPAGPIQGPAPPHKKTPNAGPKPKKPLDRMEVNNLLTAKISQLETDASLEEEEEKAISRAVRRANKELAELVSSREDHLAKVDAIQNKYSELLYEMKRLERDYTKSRKRADQLQKEKDHSRSEMQKAVSMKHKLETLCRELQKENKRIKNWTNYSEITELQETQDESKKLAQNEQQKREELSNKFENTIMEIKTRMEEENDSGSRKVDAGVDELFKAKFRSLVDQYELRELHCYSLIRTKELEVQWNLARYEQQRKQAEQEAHRAKALHAQVSTFSQTETELRSQLNIYVEKFKQVEDTLNNSNDLFLTFRKEMEEMSKKTKRLEKENLTLSRKSETTNRNLLKMAEERTKHQKELEILRKKNSKLENLCRALQAERTTLDTKLRDREGGGRGGGAGGSGERGELLEQEEEEEDDSEGNSEYEESDGYDDDDASEDGSEAEEGEDDTEDENPQETKTVAPHKATGGNQKSPQHTRKNGVEKVYQTANGVHAD
ncbi:unnamed protein product [Tuber aestivum]|uniref:Alpha-taxilin n=1 Tax=Tuber aestivum TaxID=59557 RepID=A0A292Q1R8_9PEZI|nr:unnamed protein product [Tuber aestivum]